MMSHTKSRYSFDVPNNYIDFANLSEDDVPNADSWFDQKASLENISPAGNVESGFQNSCAFSKPGITLSVASPGLIMGESHSEGNGEAERVQAHEVPQNIVGSLVSWRAAAPEEAPQRAGTRRTMRQKKAQQHTQPARVKAEGNALANMEDVPPSKKRRMRTHHSGKLKSTEEQELEKTQQFRQEVMELRRKNEESLKAVIAGAGQPVKRAFGQVTKAIDFHFCTEDRIKRNVESQPRNEYKEVDFAAELRKHPRTPMRVPKGHTIAKPFNLSQGNKRKLEENTSEYVPLAEQVEAFQKTTPPRYHLRSRKSDEGPPPGKAAKARYIKPKTTSLLTKQHFTPATCKTTTELEVEETEKLQEYKFKAQELNHRILEHGPILPKKRPVKVFTQPIGFDLEIEKRIQERASKKQQEEKHFIFHSKPCPTKILENVVGVPEKKVLPITVPKSPVFTLRSRTRMSGKDEEKEKEEVPMIKASPIPHFGVPFKPKMPEQRHVKVCPFSFDARDKERQMQKEKKIEELQKEEVPKFKALPLPYFDHVTLPEKKVKKPTQPEPFNLQVDERGAAKLQSWKQQLKEDLKKQKEAACFKARPNTVVYQEPFVPKKENNFLSVPESFELATEKRAKERQEFEKYLADKEAMREMLQEQLRQEQEESEKDEVAKLRQEMVHKANPIRKYRIMEVKSSEQPLTTPKSPNFSDRFRC